MEIIGGCIANLKYDRGQHFSLCNAIADYTNFLNDKGITYPPEIKPADMSGDLAALVTNLLEAQDKKQDKLLNTLVANNDKLVSSHDKLATSQTNSKSGPKAVQPMFTSKGNDTDFAAYRYFLSRFEFFS